MVEGENPKLSYEPRTPARTGGWWRHAAALVGLSMLVFLAMGLFAVGLAYVVFNVLR